MGRSGCRATRRGPLASCRSYPGAWCRCCNAQLAAFQRAAQRFDALGVKIAAVSVDDEAIPGALVARHRPFAVGHSTDADMVVAATGAFTNPEPIGRLVPEDVLGIPRSREVSGRRIDRGTEPITS